MHKDSIFRVTFYAHYTFRLKIRQLNRDFFAQQNNTGFQRPTVGYIILRIIWIFGIKACPSRYCIDENYAYSHRLQTTEYHELKMNLIHPSSKKIKESSVTPSMYSGKKTGKKRSFSRKLHYPREFSSPSNGGKEIVIWKR